MEKEKSQTEEQKQESRTTNVQFAGKNEEFIKACEKAEVKNSARQASKWRMGKGKAWNEGRTKE